MGEASFCLLTPCHGTSPLPISSSVPHAGPPLPPPSQGEFDADVQEVS